MLRGAHGAQGSWQVGGRQRGFFPDSGVIHTADPRELPLVPVPSTSEGETNSTLREIQAQCQAGLFWEGQEAGDMPEGTRKLLEKVVSFFPT